MPRPHPRQAGRHRRQELPHRGRAPARFRRRLALSLGNIEGRPAAYLRPRLHGDHIDWGQDRRYLVAKAAYIVAPSRDEDAGFYDRWADAIAADSLREVATAAAEASAGAKDRDLLIEMFAAYVLNPSHPRWAELPAVRGFLEGWKKGRG